MDLDSHLDKLEQINRKLFSATHYWLLTSIFFVVVFTAIYFFEPLIGLAMSGFVAFFLNYFYCQYTFKKQNDRITLLQTKIKQSGI